MRGHQMERRDDREDGDCDGVPEWVRRQPCLQTSRILASFHCQEYAGDGASFPFHDQSRHRGMEQYTVRHAADKHFLHPAVIVRAHCDKAGLYCRRTVQNEGGWMLNFAQRTDGGSFSRQQCPATLNGLTASIDQSL